MFRNIYAEQARIGYTNTKMAKFLGISRTTYEAKRNSGNFSREQIAKMLNLFDCKFEYLFATDEVDHRDSA